MDDTVRRADVADVEPFADTLTLSFLDDPVMTWVFPDHDVRARRLAAMWRFVAGGLYLPGGACTTLPGHEAVAQWRAPDAPPADAFWDEHGAELAVLLEGDLDRIGALGEAMGAHHPDEPHWYLLAIGTRPEVQGRGLGSVLLAHTLATADERGEPAYLEATSPRSRALYARFGFEVVEEFAPDGCPPLWAMWRDPA